jgi:hypothetical protein
MKLKAGDRVTHRQLPEYGVGVVDDASTQTWGTVGVAWSNGSHSYSLVASLDRAKRAAGSDGR